MTVKESTKNKIEQILKKEFAPKFLEVIDESAFHKNHLAALEKPQAGHFKLTLVSDRFNGLLVVQRHRLVYQALKDLMDSHIHAISMDLRSTNEA